ncbi:MAG: efflux RND transporter permease subunit [Terrimicrobiaceae bacterium]
MRRRRKPGWAEVSRAEARNLFGEIVVRANPDGSMLRVKDVARIELGAQNYAISGQLNGKPAALIALYQLPGSNAIASADGAKKTKKKKKLSEKFPADLEYVVCLDTTPAVTFALFPLFGFTVNTLSLFGLVRAIGLVVDDAIVVVEAVEHHIEYGLSPKDATFKAMQEVTGPVIAIALILARQAHPGQLPAGGRSGLLLGPSCPARRHDG